MAALALAMAIPVSAAGQDRTAPDLRQAASAILVDARDGSVILRKAADTRRAIASTTKLMTALLVLERARPADVFTATGYRPLPVESKINLRDGERMRVEDLLEGLLLESANDAAVTLAAGVAGSEAAFVREMNERARELGLNGTSYANPIGLDDPLNHSTARDLAALTRRLLRNRWFAKAVDQASAVLESGARRRIVDNRNDLIARYPFVDGVKTGHTRSAGYVLVGAAGNRLGAKVISVVLGEPGERSRDADTLALLRHGLAQFRMVKALSSRRVVTRTAVAHRDERAELVPSRDVSVLLRRGERTATRVDAPAVLHGELAAGTRVGRVSVLRGGRVVRRVPLVTAAEVQGAGPLRVVVHDLGLPLTLLLVVVIVSVVTLTANLLRRRQRARDRADRRRARARAEATVDGPPPTT
ncbi:MAG TPA: D-alanyl-D-alanine carboxypeptidase family protein [Thermoleophilaceae bacterium]|nr:D-alanyl-D-alanine carboxypeptidase family protein [Thermoleophilaceae bacterium]